MERTNKVYVIGTLSQVKDTRSGEKDGIAWIAGTAVVTSGNSEIEFKYYSSEKTKAGKANSRYANYTGLEARVGERVKVNGELSGRLWFNEGQGQVINFNELSAGFFNTPKPTEADVATFEFGGFVVKPLYERLNQKEELISYELELGQANYNKDNMQIVKFTVDKDSPDIVRAIESAYLKDATVIINGVIKYEVFVDTKVEEVAFGDPIVKTYQNTRKSFVITGGKQPVVEDGLVYTRDDIAKLQASYKTYVEGLELEAKNKADSGASAPKNGPAISDNTNRLL